MIEMLKKGGQRFLTYNEIEMYGAEVVQILRENGEKAVLILSRENTDALFRNYSEFFEESEQSGKRGITLSKIKTTLLSFMKKALKEPSIFKRLITCIFRQFKYNKNIY